MATNGHMPDWWVRGIYFEACNCDAICPCRRINGVPGGRSTHGECLGVLTWLIGSGRVGAVDVGGLAVAIVYRYSDDEEGSPWRFRVYLDERGNDAQREALADVFAGHLGGTTHDHFPWAWKPSDLLGTHVAAIEVDHTPRRQWLRIKDRISVRIEGRYPGPETVTCGIPGHDREGEELIASELVAHEPELDFEFSGTSGYAAAVFEYRA